MAEFPKGTYEYAVGGATLLLQKGDHVYVKLRSNSQISDNSDNHCTFSGFLLFDMLNAFSAAEKEEPVQR